jgi:S-adenosylmethionine hydrolase
MRRPPKLTSEALMACGVRDPVVTLLTDFGSSDAFVGVMKGVILGICPRARVVDLCHEVPPQDLETAAFLLDTAYRYFPPGAIHLAVVDPGVGGERRAVAVQAADYFFVAPDNGLLSYVLEAGEPKAAVAITNPAVMLHPVSRTFHGRDLFAPAAAHLAAGMALEELGPPVTGLRRFEVSRPALTRDRIEAHVIHCDRFGNAITDLDERTLREWLGEQDERHLVVRADAAEVRGLAPSYVAAGEGQPLAILGSSGRLEVAVNGGSASVRYGLARGQAVIVERADGQSPPPG